MCESERATEDSESEWVQAHKEAYQRRREGQAAERRTEGWWRSGGKGKDRRGARARGKVWLSQDAIAITSHQIWPPLRAHRPRPRPRPRRCPRVGIAAYAVPSITPARAVVLESRSNKLQQLRNGTQCTVLLRQPTGAQRQMPIGICHLVAAPPLPQSWSIMNTLDEMPASAATASKSGTSPAGALSSRALLLFASSSTTSTLSNPFYSYLFIVYSRVSSNVLGSSRTPSMRCPPRPYCWCHGACRGAPRARPKVVDSDTVR